MVTSNHSNGTHTKIDTNSNAAIERFKQFLKIRTITEEMPTTGTNKQAIEFLTQLFESLDLTVKTYTYEDNRIVLVASWLAENSDEKSILLNSHYDVVPVSQTEWECDAFQAVEKDNWIYGRGTQDMKCVCMGYIEAIAVLKQQGYKPSRSIHLSYMPDEENSGRKGMGNWSQSDDFKALNVGFALDEGLANESNKMTVFNGERAIWWLTIKATGQAGHGSRFVNNTAMPKLIKTINQFLQFRQEQQEQLECGHANCSHALKKKQKLGDVTTVNLTMLKGGVTSESGHHLLNVIPTEAYAGFDIRVPPTVNMTELEEQIKQYCNVETGITYDFIFKVTDQSITDTNPQTNAYWRIFTEQMQKLNIDTEVEIFPAGTDARYLRALQIPSIGFSPMNNTPILLHDHNERIHKDTYLRGIEIYTHLISALGSDKL